MARMAVHLDDEDVERMVHLGCRQPHAVVLAHRLDHVVDELLDLRA
jgi:hypothetical protein